MTDATVAPPETADEPQTDVAPDATEPSPEPLGPPPSLESITVALPPPPGPANVSPDNTTLAYLQLDETGNVRLWLQAIDDAEGAGPRAIDLPFTPLVEVDPAGDPSADDGPQWSPDGQFLALTGAHPTNGNPEIWRVAVATGEAVLLTDHPAADRGPRWSPDGETIAFTSFRDGRDAVCTVPAAGGSSTQWTDGVQDDRDPAWSRDGTQLAFRRAAADHPTNHDIWVLTLATGELKQVTNVPGRANSKAANRRWPRWAPNRSLIAFVTDEKEWDSIAVVNPENLSGWTLADEPGDKAEVRWSPNGLRILYTRTQGAVTACCAKGTSAAKPDVLDPQDGVARAPRWLGDFRAVYQFADPTTPWRFITQDTKTEAERRTLATAASWSGPSDGLTPAATWQLDVGDGAAIGGQLFKRSDARSGSPAVVLLDEGPPVPLAATPNLLAQALAASGITVFAPNLRGTPGNGRSFTNALAELADQEFEAADLADVAVGLRSQHDAPVDRIGIAGRGYGATLALLAAASRPGHYSAVVAVDPVVDWETELDAATGPWRSWLRRQFGLPSLQAGRFALRSPVTFAALLTMPVLLVGTRAAPPTRSDQLDDFAAVLDEFGVGYERAAADDPVAGAARLAVEFFQRHLTPVEPESPPAAEPEDLAVQQPDTETAPEAAEIGLTDPAPSAG